MTNWTEIKISISEDLSSRGLKKPQIRLKALAKIEIILKNDFPDFIENPKENFQKIDRKDLKIALSKFKPNKKLNSAKSSIINEIYYRI